MRGPLLAGCLLLAGCTAGSPAGDEAQPDAAPRPPGADASPRADAAPRPDAAPEAGADVVHRLCIGGEHTLRVSVALKFQPDNACYPEPDVDSFIFMLPIAGASPGQTVSLSPDGGYAYFCPGNDGGDCQEIEDGTITFDTWDPDEGTSGSFSIAGGTRTGSFDASWCAPDPPCG